MITFLTYFFFLYLLPAIFMGLIVRYREKLHDLDLENTIFGYFGLIFVPVYNFICLLAIIVIFIIMLIEKLIKKIGVTKFFKFIHRKLKEFLRIK